MVGAPARLLNPTSAVRELLDELGVYEQLRHARRKGKRSHQRSGGQRTEPEPPRPGSAWPARPSQQLPGVQPQRRLKPKQLRRLIRAYRLGASVPMLVRRFEVHSTTVARHLERAGVASRGNVRKLTDELVAEASVLHEVGWSFKRLGECYGVNAETVRREVKSFGKASTATEGS